MYFVAIIRFAKCARRDRYSQSDGSLPFEWIAHRCRRRRVQAIMDILFTDTKTRQVDRPMEGFGNDGGYSSSSSPSSSYSPGGYSSSSAYAPSSSSSYGSSYPSSSSYSSGGGHRRMEGMGNITFPAHKEQSGTSLSLEPTREQPH